MNGFTCGDAGVVGKLPTRAEYLPVPTHAPGFANFDAWLSQAIEWAARLPGPAWAEAFAHGAMHGFVFRGVGDEPEALLCGAISPSRDSAGRQFPLALAAPLRLSPELLARPELLPFTLEGLWSEAAGGLGQLLADKTGAPLPQPPPRLDATTDADTGEAARLYGDWVGQLPLGELFSLLGPALVNPATTLQLLFETLLPLRGVERPDTTLSLRLPLGLAGGAALCVWLDLVRRFTGWQATVPSVFWSHDGTTGAALLHLGRPPRAALAELWLPSGARDEIADLTSAPSPDLGAALSPLPPAVLAVLAEERASVAALLAALAA